MPHRLRNGSSRAFRRDFSRQAQRVNDAAKIFRVLTDAAFSGRQIQQQGIRRTIREHGSAENIRRNRVDNERKRMQLTIQSARIQAVIARAVHAGEICLSPIGLSMVNKLTPIRFASLMMGIWYLSTATANKFAGTLSGLYPEAGKVKTLLGYRIETMYDFFMVFVVMSATASLILFLLSKKLQKMMHGVE